MRPLMRRREWFTPATGPRTTLRPMLLAALAGASTVFAFAPYSFWPLQVISLAFLFYQIGLDTAPRRSFWVGFAYGFGWTVAGMHWIYISMHRYGGMHPALATAGVALFGIYIGLYSGAATALASWLRKRWSLPVPAFLLLAMPACWVLLEWLRGWLFTGYPGGAIGYAHIDGQLNGVAPVLGVYGVSLAAAVCAGALLMITQKERKSVLLLMGMLVLGSGLKLINWTTPHGERLHVRLVQGNIDQSVKFDPAHVAATLEQIHTMVTSKRPSPSSRTICHPAISIAWPALPAPVAAILLLAFRCSTARTAMPTAWSVLARAARPTATISTT
jgi:apolipoprotein N-acyltransferase